MKGKQGGKKDDPSGSPPRGTARGGGGGSGSGSGKKTAGSNGAKPAVAANVGGGGNPSDVYGDLFNLGPSTFGDEAAMAGMSNHMLYFGEDDAMPPTSSWDITVPSISGGQENQLASIPSMRSPTPVSNFAGGAAVDAARQAGEVGGPGPGANPYDPYYMAQQQQQQAMYAHNPHVSAHPNHPDATGYGGPMAYGVVPGPSGSPGTSAYGVGQPSTYGMYGGRQHLQHHHQQHYMPGMPPQHPHAAQQQAVAAHHRSMSHYSAGARLPVNMSSNALSSSGAAAVTNSTGGGGGKVGRGRYSVDQNTSGNANVGGASQGKGSGTKASKKKASNKRKGRNMDAAGAASSGGGYMQPAAPAYHMHGPPTQAYGYPPPGRYNHQPGPVGPGNNNIPHYSHLHSQGVGQKMRQTAAAAAGVIQPNPDPIGDQAHQHQHQHHGGRKQFPMTAMAPGPQDQQQQQALLNNSASQLGDEQLAFYVRQMLVQLQQVISMLDVNTKKTISDSLLRLASTKQQISASGSAAQQHQSHQDRQIDRSICQLLYNNH